MENGKLKTQIKIGPFVGSYANIFKPRAADEKSEPKYSVSLLVPKTMKDNTPEAKSFAELKKTIAAVAALKFGPNWQKIPKFHNPIRDGDVDKPEHKEYAGKFFCNASSTRPPGVVNRQLLPIMNDQDAYSGCSFIAQVNVYAFEKAGNRGVALGLNNLLVFEKLERIDGRQQAAEAFAEYVPSESEGSGGAESPLD